MHCVKGDNSSVTHPFVPDLPSLLGVSTTSCILSIVGGIVIIWTFVVLPSIRNTTRKFVTSLTVADLLTAFGKWFVISFS